MDLSHFDFSRVFAADVREKAAEKPGLWANIRAKRERGGKPAQPGDKDYPAAKSWKKVTNISAKKQANHAEPLTETTAAGQKYNWDEMNAQSKQRALRTEGAVRKYLQAWAAKHTKDPEYIQDSWEDLEDNLPLRWGPGGFDPHYMVDDLHMDIGNKLRDPAQFDAGLKSLLPKLHLEKQSGSPAWQRAAGKNEEGGLNAKGRASYNKATGGNLKAPVTEENPKGDRAKRQNSFCSRMCGMKRENTGSEAKKDPDSRINKSLRKWNCKCGSAMEFGEMLQKQAFGIGTTVGTVGGLLTGRKKDRANAAWRGFLKGFGTDIGLGAGGALGGAAGMALSGPYINASGHPTINPTAALLGLVGGAGLGGVLGHSAVSNLIGPYEPEEDKEETKMAAFEFGCKVAEEFKFNRPTSVVDPAKRPRFNGKENLFDMAHVDDMYAKARPMSYETAHTATNNLRDFNNTLNPMHLVRGVGNTWAGLGQVKGETWHATAVNDPRELALQNAEFDAVENRINQQNQARAARSVPRSLTGTSPWRSGALSEAMTLMRPAMPAAQPQNLFEQAEALDSPQGMTKAQSARDFGAKLATVTMCKVPAHNDQSGVDVNPVAAGTPEGKEQLTKKKAPVKAEDVVESKSAQSCVNSVSRPSAHKKTIRSGGNLNPMSFGEDAPAPSADHETDANDFMTAYEFGKKVAQSLVNFVERKPKDLTKGTLNPRAAGEQHEEPAKEAPAEHEADDGLNI